MVSYKFVWTEGYILKQIYLLDMPLLMCKKHMNTKINMKGYKILKKSTDGKIWASYDYKLWNGLIMPVFRFTRKQIHLSDMPLLMWN